MRFPLAQPIAHLAWQQTQARARRVAQALCLRHGDRIDADELAGTLKVQVELVHIYLAAAQAERELRNIQSGEPMSSAAIARAMSSSSSETNHVSPATVRRYIADPSGSRNRRPGQHTRSSKRSRETALKWPATLVLERILEWQALYGTWPNGYDWTQSHAVRRGGDALLRWSTGHWPDAQTVRRLCHTFPSAVDAARRYHRTTLHADNHRSKGSR